LRGQQESEYNLYMIGEFDVAGVLSSLMDRSPAGFAIALHIHFQAPALLFQTYPMAWLEEYSRDGLMMQDPTVAWAMSQSGLVRWEDLDDQDPSGVLARARSHGLRHGFTVSLHDGASLSIGGFARADRPFAPPEMEDIRALVTGLHEETATGGRLPSETREALRRLSVAFTQPSPAKDPGPAS
jgi:LuxR family transcriptional regulator